MGSVTFLPHLACTRSSATRGAPRGPSWRQCPSNSWVGDPSWKTQTWYTVALTGIACTPSPWARFTWDLVSSWETLTSLALNADVCWTVTHLSSNPCLHTPSPWARITWDWVGCHREKLSQVWHWMLSCLLDSDSPSVMMVLFFLFFFVCVGNLSLLSSSARVKVDCPTHAQVGVPRMQKCKSLSAENSELSKFPFFYKAKWVGAGLLLFLEGRVYSDYHVMASQNILRNNLEPTFVWWLSWAGAACKNQKI